jgi:uncharacterized protein (DUF433 family)
MTRISFHVPVSLLQMFVNRAVASRCSDPSLFEERIDRDSVGSPFILYPFIPDKPSSKVVAIKPSVSSGVPIVSGTGLSIPILYGRFTAGDSISDLADDYELSAEKVEDAISYLHTA